MSEVITPAEEWTKPLPTPDDVNREYWQAAADGRLLIQTCPDCGQRQFYPRALCTHCGGQPEWLECTGRGTVHTRTIIRQMGMRPFRNELPYVVAIADRGPRAALLDDPDLLSGLNVHDGHVTEPAVARDVLRHQLRLDDVDE